MKAGLSLRQGMCVKDSPPAARKIQAGHADFLKRLKAVGGEGGRDHEEIFFAGAGQAREFVVGVGFEPWFAGEAGLE